MHGTWKCDMTTLDIWTWAQVVEAHPMVKETRHLNTHLQTHYKDTHIDP